MGSDRFLVVYFVVFVCFKIYCVLCACFMLFSAFELSYLVLRRFCFHRWRWVQVGSGRSVWFILIQVVQVTQFELFTFFLFFFSVASLLFFASVCFLAVLNCSKFVLAVFDYSRLFQLVSSCSVFWLFQYVFTLFSGCLDC